MLAATQKNIVNYIFIFAYGNKGVTQTTCLRPDMEVHLKTVKLLEDALSGIDICSESTMFGTPLH